MSTARGAAYRDRADTPRYRAGVESTRSGGTARRFKFALCDILDKAGLSIQAAARQGTAGAALWLGG